MKMSQRMIGKAALLALAVSAAQLGCAARPVDEGVESGKGHFENFGEDALRAYKGQQQVIAEHAPSQGIVMSYTMFSEHHREDMAEAFLRSGIDTLWVVVPSDYTDCEERRDLRALYERVGRDRQKIKLLRQPVSGKLREWARDFAPLTARTPDGALRLLDFNYHADRPADDSVPQELARMMKVKRISLPVYNEGGNFMSNRRGECLMTERVVIANEERQLETDEILDREQIRSYYKDYAGCQKVVIFPKMPYEGTKHIDLWSKFIDDDTVIVAAIPEQVLTLKSYTAEERKRVGEIKGYLDERAQEIEKLGYQVVRLPMPAPFFAEDGFNLFRSYTNSLLLNGTVFLPKYVEPSNELDGIDGRYIDDEYLEGYNREVEKTHASLGLTVRWIESDSLISKGGAVHCTTMQIAR